MSLRSKALSGAAALTILLAPAMATSVVTAAPVPTGHSHSSNVWTAVGKWKKHTDYHVGDVVRYKGKSYVAVKASHNKKPRGSKSWNVVAANGTPGTNGTNGTNGVNGAPGATGATGAVGPNWVVKDSKGTTLGIFAGVTLLDGPRSLSLPVYNVLYQGGIWSYFFTGDYYGSAMSVKGASLDQNFPFYPNADCTGQPVIAVPSTSLEMISMFQKMAGSSYRWVADANGQPVGYEIAATAVPSEGSATLYAWSEPDQESDPHVCEPVAHLETPYLQMPVTQVPLPPLASGGLVVTAP